MQAHTTACRILLALAIMVGVGAAPAPGSSVIVEPSVGDHGGVMTPDFHLLGLLKAKMRRARADVVGAQVGPDGRVEVEFFGPRGLR